MTAIVIHRSCYGDRNFTVPLVLSLEEAVERIRHMERIIGELFAYWA